MSINKDWETTQQYPYYIIYMKYSTAIQEAYLQILTWKDDPKN